MKLFSRLLFFSAISGILITLFLTFPFGQAKAQTYTSNSPYLQLNTDPNIPNNTHTLIQSLFLDMLSTIQCYLSGVDPLTQDHKCIGLDTQTGKLGYVPSQGGAIGFMAGLIGNTYYMPVHFDQYMSYVSHNFHPLIASPSYAAASTGVGAQGLGPILPIWAAFRNIAYTFVVIIFVVVGIGIMLRIKIDPRTVMTIQNTIPRIIIGLLLITFSFAIAGFLIDMTYVLTYLFLHVLANALNDTDLANKLSIANNPYDAVNVSLGWAGGIMAPINGGTNLIARLINDALHSNIIGGIISLVLSFTGIGFLDLGCTIIHIFNQNSVCNGGVYYLVSVIVFIALLIAVFAGLFRFWVALVNSYINILFAVVLAPLRLLLGMLPGAPGGGAGSWFRDLIANLAVFPISLAFIMLVGELAKYIDAASTSNGSVVTFAMLPGFDIGQMMELVAIIAILPRLPAVILETAKTKDAFGPQFGAALGGGIKTITKGTGAAVATIAPVPLPGRPGGPLAGIQRLI